MYAINPDTFKVCKVVFSIVSNNRYKVITDNGERFSVKYLYFTLRRARQALYEEIMKAID